MSGGLLVISGPSGCGKSSLVNEILKEEKNVYFSISTTTREIRKGEKEGVNYFYTSKDEFKRGIKAGEFLEWAKIAGNDLITPHPEFDFPGLKDGDSWCVCADTYAQSIDEGTACKIYTIQKIRYRH